jgi:hypothetical protein
MILFLDFDGVLHPSFSRGKNHFSSLHLFWQLLSACQDLEVVFSTSWREDYPVEKLIQLVSERDGERYIERFIGATPCVVARTVEFPREIECRLWLYGNGQSHRDWLALDDVEESFSPDCPNLFLINKMTGLVSDQMDALIARCRSYSEPRNLWVATP